MDLAAERVILGRSAIVAGWTIGGIGAAAFAASIAGWVTLLPLKTTEVKFYLVDKSTGIISVPVSLADAPKIFSEVNDEHYLKQYIVARESWIPELDERNDHIAKMMSTPDEQGRYVAWRKLPTSPMTAPGKDGHISIENVRSHPETATKDGIHRYLVQFQRNVWRGGYLESSAPWSATVDFVWRPELPMLPADRSDNPGGMQVINYSATSDTPDQKRQ